MKHLSDHPEIDMNTTEQLFARACKSSNPDVRLHSRYRRFYCITDTKMANFSLAGILARLCDTYLHLRVTELVSDFSPSNGWKYGVTEHDDHWSATIKILASHIRVTEKQAFPGLKAPIGIRCNLELEKAS